MCVICEPGFKLLYTVTLFVHLLLVIFISVLSIYIVDALSFFQYYTFVGVEI